MNNFITTNMKDVKFCYSLSIGPNKIVPKKQIFLPEIFFVAFLFFNSVPRKNITGLIKLCILECRTSDKGQAYILFFIFFSPIFAYPPFVITFLSKYVIGYQDDIFGGRLAKTMCGTPAYMAPEVKDSYYKYPCFFSNVGRH